MSFRYNPIAVSALLLASFSVLSFAADTKPIVRDTCVRATFFPGAHPGKSSLFPKHAISRPVHCATVKPKPLILASYTEALGGRALELGQMERAIEQIDARTNRRLTS